MSVSFVFLWKIMLAGHSEPFHSNSSMIDISFFDFAMSLKMSTKNILE